MSDPLDQYRAEQRIKTIVSVILFALGWFVFNFLFAGLVLSLMWGWFVAPLFGHPGIPAFQMACLYLFLRVVIKGLPSAEGMEKRRKTTIYDDWQDLFWGTGFLGVLLTVSFVLHLIGKLT